ncbi:hypothetical protein MUB16_32150 [Priestia sp. OVL9]|nr:hypothetical protein [Priestia sp. OVL9]
MTEQLKKKISLQDAIKQQLANKKNQSSSKAQNSSTNQATKKLTSQQTKKRIISEREQVYNERTK